MQLKCFLMVIEDYLDEYGNLLEGGTAFNCGFTYDVVDMGGWRAIISENGRVHGLTLEKTAWINGHFKVT